MSKFKIGDRIVSEYEDAEGIFIVCEGDENFAGTKRDFYFAGRKNELVKIENLILGRIVSNIEEKYWIDATKCKLDPTYLFNKKMEALIND